MVLPHPISTMLLPRTGYGASRGREVRGAAVVLRNCLYPWTVVLPYPRDDATTPGGRCYQRQDKLLPTIARGAASSKRRCYQHEWRCRQREAVFLPVLDDGVANDWPAPDGSVANARFIVAGTRWRCCKHESALLPSITRSF
jgi:hypothetical protein